MATKKMEDFFNLPPASEDEEDVEIVPTKTKEELMVEANQIYSALSTAEKIDYSLPVVVGLDSHDNEMDSIAAKAVKTFEDLVNLGGNVPDMHAGKIYEVAGQMLKTALDAKNAKAERKLKMIDLQIKKAKLELDMNGAGGENSPAGGEFDRNELLRYIVQTKKSENSDK
jgi:hypothetical protein